MRLHGFEELLTYSTQRVDARRDRIFHRRTGNGSPHRKQTMRGRIEVVVPLLKSGLVQQWFKPDVTGLSRRGLHDA